MCGRFTSSQTGDEIFSETGLMPPKDWRPHYNVAPSQSVLALRRSSRGKRELTLLRWGLIPAWAHDATVGRRLVMARAETIDDKSAFAEAFHRRRCALVASGFYEWKRSREGSTPFYFRFNKPMFIAAVWERWRKYGNDIETCAVITTAANAAVAPVHDRMPVLLGSEALDVWLDPEAPHALLRPLLSPSLPELVRVFWVDKAVNDPSNDSPALLGDFEKEAQLFGRVLGGT
jgi:putative SOS response-associated peptidase YedK